MTNDNLNRFWLLCSGILILIIVVSATVIWFHRDRGQPLEVTLSEPSPFTGQIYIDGAVANPGTYPLNAQDNVSSLLAAAGGPSSDARPGEVQLHVPSAETGSATQKVDINHAEAWLLESLPGIGTVKAQAIIDYRVQNGPFQGVDELTKVPGITQSVLDKIRPFIMAGD